MNKTVQQAWTGLRDIFSSRVLGTTSRVVPRLDGGLSRQARLAITAIAVALAVIAGWIAGAPWGAAYFFPALMVAGLFGDLTLAAISLLASILVAARLFPGLDLIQFSVAATVQTIAALVLRLLFRESRRWGVRYRRLLTVMSAAVTVSDDRGRIERPHPELERLIGRAWPDYAGTRWLDSVHPDDHAKFIPAEPPGDVTVQRAEIRLKDPATGDWRWHLMRAVPLLDEDGKVEEWVSTLTDVHERKLAGEQRDMMIGEARHRLKNLMTIIESLAKSSRPRDADAGIDAYQKRLLGRLHALSAAGDLALAGNYTTINAKEVIAATLAPFLGTEPRRLTFDGPDARAQPGDRRPPGARRARAHHQRDQAWRPQSAGGSCLLYLGACHQSRAAGASKWYGRRAVDHPPKNPRKAAMAHASSRSSPRASRTAR